MDYTASLQAIQSLEGETSPEATYQRLEHKKKCLEDFRIYTSPIFLEIWKDYIDTYDDQELYLHDDLPKLLYDYENKSKEYAANSSLSQSLLVSEIFDNVEAKIQLTLKQRYQKKILMDMIFENFKRATEHKSPLKTQITKEDLQKILDTIYYYVNSYFASRSDVDELSLFSPRENDTVYNTTEAQVNFRDAKVLLLEDLNKHVKLWLNTKICS